MMMVVVAFLLLRVTLAWLFLAPLKKFLTHWEATVKMVELVAPKRPVFFAYTMIGIMFFGGLSILLGCLAQIGAVFLAAHCLLGVRAHNLYVKQLQSMNLDSQASPDNQKILNEAKKLGILGNITSGQKNIVIAAVLVFIALIGSGPYSLTENLFW